jgi:hypothetical protein
MSSRDTLDIIFLAASIICGSISASDISCEYMCATLHRLLHECGVHLDGKQRTRQSTREQIIWLAGKRHELM